MSVVIQTPTLRVRCGIGSCQREYVQRLKDKFVLLKCPDCGNTTLQTVARR